MTTIGFIGLGIMGSRMAANLQAAGHNLIVWNRTPDKADALVEKGATLAQSPAQVAAEVETLITMLAHPQAVEETALGENGFLDALSANALWIDCSTVNPSFSRHMAQEAQQRNVRFVDAPVAGTKQPAADGTLTFFAGGDADDIAACQPLFDIMGSKTVHVGAAGSGTALKMVVNGLLANAMTAFSEAMALGQTLGIKQDKLLDALIGGPVVAPFVAYKRGNIEADDYSADFPLRWMHKDLHLAALSGYENGAALPLTNANKEIYQLAMQAGLGDDDFAAIYRYLNSSTDD